jgi:hypothetical protein
VQGRERSFKVDATGKRQGEEGSLLDIIKKKK